MSPVRAGFSIAYVIVAILFFACAVLLCVFAALELWQAIGPRSDTLMRPRFNAILETIGLLTIAVASLELSQTVLEEEVLRVAQMSAPTRARRFLSRFMVVVVVSLAIESLVAVFQLVHEDPSKLPQAASIAFAAAALLAAWGVFVHLNRSAEELEPEAMAQAKSEDRKIEKR